MELACSSVASPGLEQYLKIPADQLQQIEMAFTTLIDELAYCNLNQRGFLLVDFDAKQVQAEWLFVDTIKAKSYQLDDNRRFKLLFDTQLNDLKKMENVA